MNHRTPKQSGGVRRRPFTNVVAVVAIAVVMLAGCTGNTEKPAASSGSTETGANTGGSSAPGRQVSVFSGPVADHGFLAAINRFAKEQAAKYPGRHLQRPGGGPGRAVPDRRGAHRHRRQARRTDHLPAGR